MNIYKALALLLVVLFTSISDGYTNQSSVQPTQVVRQNTETIYEGEYWMGEKLIRGIANTVGAPLEIHRSVRNNMAEHGDIVGLTGGFFEGIGLMVVRAVVGVVEIATFPLPTPDEYRPVLAPEFIWPGTRQTPYTSPEEELKMQVKKTESELKDAQTKLAEAEAKMGESNEEDSIDSSAVPS